jgi:hypothetical protein
MDVPCHSTAEFVGDLFDSWCWLKEDMKEADAEEGFCLRRRFGSRRYCFHRRNLCSEVSQTSRARP